MTAGVVVLEQDMKNTTQKPLIQSVARAIHILECFNGETELGITEISHRVQLHKSTTFGLVSTLETYQLLEKNEDTGKYHLGVGLFRLGSRVNMDLRSIVSPHLDKLVNICGETVNLVVPDGTYVVYLDKKESPHSMRITTAIGQRQPMYRTATGKAILAQLPYADARDLLYRSDFQRMTIHTLLTPNEVLQELNVVRQQGYAMDREELEYGLVCLGVALVDLRGHPVGAISISGPASRMQKEECERYSSYLIDSAKQINNLL